MAFVYVGRPGESKVSRTGASRKSKRGDDEAQDAQAVTSSPERTTKLKRSRFLCYSLIVSGSNMSGKSTYLRTVGINAVLALMGAPVRARRLRLSPLVVGATLRIQDSLQAGRSRFYAEALRVRQLLDLAKHSPPLLFLLDELFQGTNSQDRRVGAEAVLRILINFGAIGMVTTHDLALTDIADRLAPLTANVHFEDRFDESALVFNYRLRPGKVQSGNGLALLRAVGIEL